MNPSQRQDASWLVLETQIAPADARRSDDAALLLWSALLPGGVKFARAADAAGLALRAELPAPEIDDAVGAVGAVGLERVQAGFACAADRLAMAATGESLAAREAAADGPDRSALPAPAALEDLASRCAEAGWPGFENAEDGVSIDLGVPGLYVPARVRAEGDGDGAGISVSADLTDVPEGGSLRRQALAALLLRLNATHRMVRAVFREDGDGETQTRARLEAWVPAGASPARLGEAIAATAVAARHGALEAQSLAHDDRLARSFLAQRNGAPGSV